MALLDLLSLVIALVVGAGLAYALARGRAQSAAAQQQQQAQQQMSPLREQLAVLQAQADARELIVTELKASLNAREQELQQAQQALSQRGAELAGLNTELDQQRLSNADKIKTLEDTKQQLGKEFELLANRIFEEKAERFDKVSKTTLEGALNPLREQLTDFKKKVEDVYDKDSKERISLGAQLNQLKELNQQMSTDTLNLTKALKGDNKAQGNWGEVILERVLEESGLHKGREYDTQVALKSEDGRRRNPDVIVRLPENKDLVIDSKVSLLHYERYCNSDDEAVRVQALKEHVASVRAHIHGLSFKDYEKLEGIRTLDFVFIFIPIESAFMAAFEHDQAMFRDAYEKNIIVVSPTTLLATLRTVQSIWRYERQNKNAEEIARQAGAMHDKFVGFVADLDKIAEHLDKAGQAREAAMNKLISGKGNLVGSTQRLEKLGAKVKKSLSTEVVEQALESELKAAGIESSEPVPTEPVPADDLQEAQSIQEDASLLALEQEGDGTP